MEINPGHGDLSHGGSRGAFESIVNLDIFGEPWNLGKFGEPWKPGHKNTAQFFEPWKPGHKNIVQFL